MYLRIGLEYLLLSAECSDELVTPEEKEEEEEEGPESVGDSELHGTEDEWTEDLPPKLNPSVGFWVGKTEIRPFSNLNPLTLS